MSASSAVRVADLLDTMGVVTHIDYTDGGYANINADLAALRYLGINEVRDAAPNPASDLYGQTHLGDAANAGVKFVFTAQGGVDPSIMVQGLHAFAAAHPGSIIGIEGPNEVNNWPVSYQGLTGTAGAQAYQTALFNAVNADPLLRDIPVIGFTDYPAHASASDLNNTHPYAKNGDQPHDTILSSQTQQNAVDPGKPFVITETGYHNSLTADTAGGWEGVDETTQAKLLLNTFMDAVQLGAKDTFVYELLDAYPDPGGSNQETHFGLFRLDNSPKPAATAIHNLTTMLQDSGTNSSSFDPGTLNYSVSGLAGTGHTYLTEKSDGSFQIIAWNAPDIWDEANDRAIVVPATNVTVNLGQTFSTVQVFDPLQGTATVQTLHNVSVVNLGLSDHLLIVQASGAGSTSPAATTIESFGSTELVQVGQKFYFDSVGTGAGPSLKYGGADFVSGQFGAWTPIGVDQTATGYELAWRFTGSDQFTVWSTDSSGNYTAHVTAGSVSGSSNALESLEPSFAQDLNGDGGIGIPAAQAASSNLLTSNLESQQALVTVASNDTFVFRSGRDAGVLANSADTSVLHGFSAANNLLQEAQAGQSQALFQWTNDGHGPLVDPGHHDGSNAHFAHPHMNGFIVH
jgi:hypothetical protein